MLRTPWAVAATVLILYGAWFAIASARGHDPYDSAFVGTDFLERSSASPVIESNAPHARPGAGYDGQFFLFIAQDPVDARHYVDAPGYRYGRILYPMSARATAEALPIGIPTALIAINVLAVSVGVLVLAVWLRRRGSSPWIALVFGLHPGLFLSVLRDVSDGMAYSLVALAVLAADHRRRWGIAASAALFAAAILTREATAVFAIVWGGALLFDGTGGLRWRRALLFTSAALAPAALYRAFLWWWLDEVGAPAQLRPSAIPFGGLFEWWPWGLSELFQLGTVVLPGTLCLVLAVWALRRGVVEPAVLALALMSLLYVVLLPAPVFGNLDSALRVPLGAVTALTLAVPALRGVFGPSSSWLAWPVVAWLYPWSVVLPFAAQEAW